MSKPIAEKQSGQVKIAVWKNEQYGMISYSFQKSYKDKSGTWKNTNFFSKSDLSEIVSLCNYTLFKLLEKKETKQVNNETQKQETKQETQPTNLDAKDIPSGDVPF